MGRRIRGYPNIVSLGSAQVKFSVLRINDYMAAYFGTSPYNSVGLNQLISDLYQVSLRGKSSEIQDLGRLHEPNRPGKASFPARWSFFHCPNSVDCLQTFFPLQGLS